MSLVDSIQSLVGSAHEDFRDIFRQDSLDVLSNNQPYPSVLMHATVDGNPSFDYVPRETLDQELLRQHNLAKQGVDVLQAVYDQGGMMLESMGRNIGSRFARFQSYPAECSSGVLRDQAARFETYSSILAGCAAYLCAHTLTAEVVQVELEALELIANLLSINTRSARDIAQFDPMISAYKMADDEDKGNHSQRVGKAVRNASISYSQMSGLRRHLRGLDAIMSHAKQRFANDLSRLSITDIDTPPEALAFLNAALSRTQETRDRLNSIINCCQIEQVELGKALRCANKATDGYGEFWVPQPQGGDLANAFNNLRIASNNG